MAPDDAAADAIERTRDTLPAPPHKPLTPEEVAAMVADVGAGFERTMRLLEALTTDVAIVQEEGNALRTTVADLVRRVLALERK